MKHTNRSPSDPPDTPDAPDAGEVWSRFGDDLRAFILKRVRNPDDAEDVLQDVFVRIHRGLPGLVDDNKLLPWVYRITRNAVTDLYRKREAPSSLDHEPEAEDPPDDAKSRQQVGRCLRQLLTELPENDRDVLEQVEINNVPQTEYARQAGLSASGAKSRVQRARRRLKQELLDCCEFQFDRFGKPTDDAPSHCKKDCGCMDEPA